MSSFYSFFFFFMLAAIVPLCLDPLIHWGLQSGDSLILSLYFHVLTGLNL